MHTVYSYASVGIRGIATCETPRPRATSRRGWPWRACWIFICVGRRTAARGMHVRQMCGGAGPPQHLEVQSNGPLEQPLQQHPLGLSGCIWHTWVGAAIGDLSCRPRGETIAPADVRLTCCVRFLGGGVGRWLAHSVCGPIHSDMSMFSGGHR